MRRFLAGAVIFSALLSSASAQYVVKRYEYTVGDIAAEKSIDADKKEHHCILFDGAVPVYVVGTYGGFGYFEGSFIIPAAAAGNVNEASVSWWETTADDDGLTPAAGGAHLYYPATASSWATTVSGSFWYVAPFSGGYAEWFGTGGELKETSEDVGQKKQAEEAFLMNCLLSKPDAMAWSPDIMGAALTSGLFHAAPTATSKMAKLAKTSWKSAQGTNDFCVDQYNVKAKYTYKYSKAEAIESGGKFKEGDIEVGDYGVTAGWGGPFAKNSGSNIYKVAWKPDGSFQLVGWYCNSDKEGSKFLRTACFPEQYDLAPIDPNACAWTKAAATTATASIPRPTLTYLSQIAIGVLVMIGSMYST